ncbi:MAG TPA: hypothetical protein ENH11_06430 [Candidatus Acetothermia bacterium]|nr:hypothetical protein [Candidatus Acetothermia bacterium]
MPTSIIQSRPGKIHMLMPDDGAVPGTLIAWKDGGPGGATGAADFRKPMPITITGIGFNQAVNIQFMPTLKKLVYVYAFGDKMGLIRLSGLAFDNNCDGGESGWGTRALFDYYQENRAVRDGQVVRISIAGEVITGFLKGMDISLSSVEFKTMGFVMHIATLPRKGRISPSAAASAPAPAPAQATAGWSGI